MGDIQLSTGAVIAVTALLGSLAAAVGVVFRALMASKDAQIAKAEARESEWRRLAVRGATEVIPPLATEVRVQAQETLRALREPQ